MPDPWYPAATQDRGVASGYAYGRTIPVSVVAHFTVGRDSTAIGRDQGLFQFLIRRDGEVVQFSEVDSVCYHAGRPYNLRGPGIEVEYLPGADDDIFSPAAYDATARLVAWLGSEWGIPADYYDNPAVRIGDWNGYISHRSVVSDADYHSDYWPSLPVTASPVPSPEEPVKGIFLTVKGGDGKVWFFNDGVRVYARSPEYVNMTAYFGQAVDNVAHEVSQSQLDSIPIWDPQ